MQCNKQKLPGIFVWILSFWENAALFCLLSDNLCFPANRAKVSTDGGQKRYSFINFYSKSDRCLIVLNSFCVLYFYNLSYYFILHIIFWKTKNNFKKKKEKILHGMNVLGCTKYYFRTFVVQLLICCIPEN